MQTTSSDIELWIAFKNGDKKSFSELFRRYYSLLFRYGSKLCQDPDLLEDCIQELFLELWQSRSATQVQSVKAYLLRALKYKIFKLNRNEKARQMSEISDEMAFELSPENFLINKQEDKQKLVIIIEAIQQLPNRQREIVYLKLYHGLSYDELSEVMQINYQAARNLFYQAIKSLRNILVNGQL